MLVAMSPSSPRRNLHAIVSFRRAATVMNGERAPGSARIV
jgi:hypothetical protein